jgi:RNA polymerase sigma factor (sigma-70 family)
MDETSSQTPALRTSERAALATPDKSAEAASVGKPQGIYDLASRFGVIFTEITLGVKDVMPKDVDPEDWADYFEDIVLEAWKHYCADPEYFARGDARRWAGRSAHNRRLNEARNLRYREIRDAALMNEYLAGNYDAKTLDMEFEDEERGRAIFKAFQVLTPRRRSVAIAMLIRGLTKRETATELGLSERIVRREYEAGRHDLALELSQWQADPSPPRGRDSPTRKARSARARLARTLAPLRPPRLLEGGNHDQPS